MSSDRLLIGNRGEIHRAILKNKNKKKKKNFKSSATRLGRDILWKENSLSAATNVEFAPSSRTRAVDPVPASRAGNTPTTMQ